MALEYEAILVKSIPTRNTHTDLMAQYMQKGHWAQLVTHLLCSTQMNAKKEHIEKRIKQSYVKNLDRSDFFTLARDESFSCIKHKLRINVIDEIRITSGLSLCKTLHKEPKDVPHWLAVKVLQLFTGISEIKYNYVCGGL